MVDMQAVHGTSRPDRVSRPPLAARALAVTAGWYTMAFGGLALWWISLPTDVLLMAVFIGLPALAAGVLVSLTVLTTAVALPMRSALAAGTLAALTGGAVGFAVAIVMSTPG
jgi:hypothetical protein